MRCIHRHKAAHNKTQDSRMFNYNTKNTVFYAAARHVPLDNKTCVRGINGIDSHYSRLRIMPFSNKSFKRFSAQVGGKWVHFSFGSQAVCWCAYWIWHSTAGCWIVVFWSAVHDDARGRHTATMTMTIGEGGNGGGGSSNVMISCMALHLPSPYIH